MFLWFLIVLTEYFYTHSCILFCFQVLNSSACMGYGRSTSTSFRTSQPLIKCLVETYTFVPTGPYSTLTLRCYMYCLEA
jgi:hypothetical protein